MKAITTLGALLIGAILSTAATAEPLPKVNGYPAQPLRFISPFPPGGGNDATTRWVTTKLPDFIGQAAVVDNRGGAGGNIGAKAVVDSKPDGYTLLTGQVSLMAVNPTLYSAPGFEPLKNFIPITQVNAAPLAIVVASASPVKSFADLATRAKADPGKITFATPGNGTLSHLVGAVLSKEKGVPMTHVPYKGAGPALNDLLGQQVDVLITSTSSVAGMIQSGQLRALAVTSPRRVGIFTKVPTLEELGLTHATYEDWYGFFAPAGTPPERVKYLHEAITRTLRTPEVTKLVIEGGSEVVANTPEEFTRQVTQDMKRWGDLVKLSGAKLD
ncbi:tripartite tricarboxylate transporter substrate binding protein [Diaphorobacter sp.]|uniref:Bug family tripartite tricarboxylate transporter substrate binding protein n=1 Tax=Diaphorobacter sp. TaxID=1934310 RepID=UPI0028A705F9|nr:tripartite tricarboxylate transporter substrate binding protein [Diaphorobacter sp.]